MKSSRNANIERAMRLCLVLLLAALAGAAKAAVPWILEDVGNTERGTLLEAAFYRMMDTPGGSVSYRRPVKETRSALSDLIRKTPADANLYMLRALEDERQLDFAAAEIDWIEADDYYAAIYARGRRHLIRESLSSFEARLDPVSFVRVHRSAIVNLDRVREVRVEPGGESHVVLRDGTRVPVSRRRREQVNEALRTPAR